MSADKVPALLLEDAPRVAERRTAITSLIRATGWPGVALAFFLVVVLVGPWLAPQDPFSYSTDLDLPPLAEGHVLGTDQLGRDLLSRMLHGGRLSFVTALAPVGAAFVIGLGLGALAGFGPRWLAFAVMRITDVAFAFPAIMLAIAIAAMLGPSLRNAILAMIIVLIPPITRVARAAALEVSGQPYMGAARLSGAPRWRIVLDFALPNMVAPVLVYSATLCGVMIIFAAGLSFLGLGVQPPTSEWGLMIAEGRPELLINPWITIIPGVCIFLVSMAFNFVADRLRDHLDPSLQ